MTIVRGALDAELAQLAIDVAARGPSRLPEGLDVLAARPERWVVRDAGRRIVVKAFARDRAVRRLVGGIIGARAVRAFDATVRARALGVPMPEPLAAIELPGGGSALVSAELVGAQGLRDTYRALPSIAARRALARDVAALLADAHAAGVYPSDFNDTNVVVDGAGRVVLVDAEGLRFTGRVSLRRRVRNLERLLRAFLGAHRVSRATRLRFLRVYARDRAEARRLWRLVAARSAEKRAAYGLAPP